jgi:hypothetical protein
MPGITLDGEISRLRTNFINGIQHMPVRFTARPSYNHPHLHDMRVIFMEICAAIAVDRWRTGVGILACGASRPALRDADWAAAAL